MNKALYFKHAAAFALVVLFAAIALQRLHFDETKTGWA